MHRTEENFIVHGCVIYTRGKRKQVARLVSSSVVVDCKPPWSYSNLQYWTVFYSVNVKADQCGRVRNSLKAA